MKRATVLLLVILLILSASPLAQAANAKIVDDAGLLTPAQMQKLEQFAQSLAANYGIDAVIVTVDTLDGKSAQAYADDYFDYNGYGVGSNDSGVLFLLAMEEREYYVSTHADGNSAVTYSEIGDISDRILGDLSAGNYYNAFSEYLDLLEKEFKSYRNGDTEAALDFTDIALRLGVALLIGAAIAGIVLLIMRGKMNTAKQQSGAGSYIVDSSYDLYRCQDIFLYSHTTKTRKAENSSSSTHRSSSGRSHGGRGGRF